MVFQRVKKRSFQRLKCGSLSTLDLRNLEYNDCVKRPASPVVLVLPLAQSFYSKLLNEGIQMSKSSSKQPTPFQKRAVKGKNRRVRKEQRVTLKKEWMEIC